MRFQNMMTKIEQDFPLSYALDWDNSGLLAGRMEKDIKVVYLALDATADVISHAIEKRADLLITHHPLIFSPLKKINDLGFVEKRVILMLQVDMNYYAMHTNYDVVCMGKLAANLLNLQNQRILQVTKKDPEICLEEGIGRVGELPDTMKLHEYCQVVKSCFGLPDLRVYGNINRNIKTAAICPGSGKGTMAEALESGADVYITGDVGYHDALDAVERGLCIIDAGHYGIEHIFVDSMKEYLKYAWEDLVIYTEPKKMPFQIIS